MADDIGKRIDRIGGALGAAGVLLIAAGVIGALAVLMAAGSEGGLTAVVALAAGVVTGLVLLGLSAVLDALDAIRRELPARR